MKKPSIILLVLVLFVLSAFAVFNVYAGPRRQAKPAATVLITLTFVDDNATVWAPSPTWFPGATGEYFNFRNQTASGIDLFKVYPDGTMTLWEDVPAGVSDSVEAFLDDAGKPVELTEAGTNVNYNVSFVLQ